MPTSASLFDHRYGGQPCRCSSRLHQRLRICNCKSSRTSDVKLWRAASIERPAQGLIHHSDRGSHYYAHAYQELVAQLGMRASMSRRGNCYGNAPMESFCGTLKNELVHHRRYATRAEAKASIQECIEIF